jgi:hypothetical protein
MLYNTETPRGLPVNVGKYSTTTVPWESSLLCGRCVFIYIYVHAYNVNSQQCYNQLVRNYVDVNEHERISNITLRHKLK